MGQNIRTPRPSRRSPIAAIRNSSATCCAAFPRAFGKPAENSRQLSRVAWIADELLPLESIPAGLHEPLSAFVQATGMNLDDKIEDPEMALAQRQYAGGQAGLTKFGNHCPESVQGILFGSLDSENEDVQVWATGQLAQGVPEAIRLLIERLDSPVRAVQEAAREELEASISRRFSILSSTWTGTSACAWRTDAENRPRLHAKVDGRAQPAHPAAANSAPPARQRPWDLPPTSKKACWPWCRTRTRSCGESRPSCLFAFPARKSSSG